MKHTYILKKSSTNVGLQKIDNDHREKIEKIIGKKLSDKAWFDYKLMVINKPKN